MNTTAATTSRRQFLTAGGAVLATAALHTQTGRAFASPLGLPIGLQLYSVHEMLPKDFVGTLQQLAALGFQEVEAAGFYGHSAPEVRAAMQTAGLALVSGHFSFHDYDTKLDQTLQFAAAAGLRYVVCSSPGFRDPARVKDSSYRGQMSSYALEDFRWTAERLNVWGRAAKAAGLQLAYHNYTVEFVPQGGVVPFAEMLRLTDPALVSFELDCGWAAMGGGDPVALLRGHPQRFPLLHIKDFKPATAPVTPLDPPPPAVLGQGTVDFHAIFQAARGTAVRHIFAEQEGYDRPPLEALRMDVAYLRSVQR